MYPSKTPDARIRAPRLSGWIVLTLVLLACVWAIAPQQLPVSLYKLSLVTLAAVVGYWIDRSLFPYARPNVFMALGSADPLPPLDCSEDTDSCVLVTAPNEAAMRLMSAAMIRRAIIVGCAMLAMGLGA